MDSDEIVVASSTPPSPRDSPVEDIPAADKPPCADVSTDIPHAKADPAPTKTTTILKLNPQTYPTAAAIADGNSLVAKVLGPRQWDLSAVQVVAAEPDMPETKLRHLRRILEENVMARTDMQALHRTLEAEMQVRNAKAINKDLLRVAQGIEAPKEMKDDLRDMGFNAKQVRDIAAKKEVRLPDGHLPKGVQAVTTGQRRAKREGKSKATDYEPLQLGRDPSKSSVHGIFGKADHVADTLSAADWVLFDPLRGYSDFPSQDLHPLKHSEPPPMFQQYETYQPGNRRILEYNVTYGSVRLRTTPASLGEGKEVLYTSNGPKLVEMRTHRRSAGRGKRRAVGRKEFGREIDEESDLSELSDMEIDELS